MSEVPLYSSNIFEEGRGGRGCDLWVAGARLGGRDREYSRVYYLGRGGPNPIIQGYFTHNKQPPPRTLQ